MDPEPIVGTLDTKQEYILQGTMQTHSHTFTHSQSINCHLFGKWEEIGETGESTWE